MKLSEQWLREWVDIPLTCEQLAEQLTFLGLEVDSVTKAAPEFRGVVVAEVLAAEKHPDADKLSVCQVNYGADEPVQVVCGASNVRKGLKIAFATVGAVLPGDFKIKKAKLRGVASFGMICASTELGLAEQSEGIMELASDAPVGVDFREYYLNLDDHLIDIELTPNRGDCVSVLGVAREVAAANQFKIKHVDTPVVSPSIEDSVPVTISAQAACPRYLGRVIKNINPTATTPLWMVEKLRRSGIRAIHPVVDITNFVMLELGQPCHAFDLAKIKGGLNIRYAQDGELLTLLDGKKATLDAQSLVITDHEKALALAGIMGGQDSAVTSKSRDILLEVAYFEPIGIAETARRHRIFTDSSYRFERGVDFELQHQAVERLTALLLEIVGGEPGTIVEAVSTEHLPTRPVIHLRQARVKRILGLDLAPGDIEKSLQLLSMQVEAVNEGWQVTPPSWRFDISLEVDLIEELARLYGYDNIPTSTPSATLQGIVCSESILGRNQLRRAMMTQGYCETVTYSFVDPALEKLVHPERHPRPLLNPISSELSVMRTSIWPSLLAAYRYNQDRQQIRARFFEIGMCFDDANDPREALHMAGLVAGTQLPEQWGAQALPVDFYDVKSNIESILGLTRMQSQFSFEPGEHPALHPGVSAKIIFDGKTVGWIGMLHPRIQQELDIRTTIYLFDLELRYIINALLPKYEAVSRFPGVRRDLAIIVDEALPVANLQQAIAKKAGPLLQQIEIFDIYAGKSIKPGKKSVALGLVFQHKERTLIDEEVNKLMTSIIDHMATTFNAELRA